MHLRKCANEIFINRNWRYQANAVLKTFQPLWQLKRSKQFKPHMCMALENVAQRRDCQSQIGGMITTSHVADAHLLAARWFSPNCRGTINPTVDQAFGYAMLDHAFFQRRG
ncbi:hypothetical protein ASE75_04830 [Sphingomonas sp. Leaf17]|nr:hypothetical protein ASE75_04830 [Sphingomonas sp. Leaf17]